MYHMKRSDKNSLPPPSVSVLGRKRILGHFLKILSPLYARTFTHGQRISVDNPKFIDNQEEKFPGEPITTTLQSYPLTNQSYIYAIPPRPVKNSISNGVRPPSIESW